MKRVNRLGGTPLLAKVQETILRNPEAGTTVSDTGGLRKIRVPDVENRWGKRGGFRVLYLDLWAQEVTYLFLIYDKTEKDDLSAIEKKQIKKLADALRSEK